MPSDPCPTRRHRHDAGGHHRLGPAGRRPTADGSPLPRWVSFDSATGTFTLRPSQGTAATLALTVTACDRESKVATTDMSLQVAHDSR